MDHLDGIYITKPFLPPLEELHGGLHEIWESGILSNQGPKNLELESEIREYLNVPYVSLFSNCTIALMVALKALDLQGNVITTPFSFPASVSSLIWNNLTPSFIDIDPKTFNLNPELIESKINNSTSAILGVHAYGYPCEIDKISEISKKYNLKLIYDGAAAYGSLYKGKSVLSHGDLSVVSFHATKIFNTFEGGAIMCSDIDLKNKIDSIRNFGFNSENLIENIGLNGKMSEFSALLGLKQMKYFEKILERRKVISNRYNQLLSSIEYINLPSILYDDSYNNTYYPILLTKDSPVSRDNLLYRLQEKKIYLRKYYSPLLNNQNIYGYFENDSSLPVANDLSQRVICLPLYPDLSQDEQFYIIEKLKQAFL
tara:strand:+ start:330 stop:1442 length:1113 start_codon:yes stop_codon:yes gene_type:complete